MKNEKKNDVKNLFKTSCNKMSETLKNETKETQKEVWTIFKETCENMLKDFKETK